MNGNGHVCDDIMLSRLGRLPSDAFGFSRLRLSCFGSICLGLFRGVRVIGNLFVGTNISMR